MLCRSVESATGEWMNSFVRRPSRQRLGKDAVDAGDIVSRGIRRSWTISSKFLHLFPAFFFFFFSFLFSFISHFLYLYSTTMLYVRLQYLRRRKSILIQRETERMQCISIELTLDWNSCIQIKSNLFIRYHWKQLVTHHS